MNSMTLLIFAHRGEAQTFFNEWELLPVAFHFPGLFKNKDHYVLITGEGPKDASEKTVAVVSAIKSEIKNIFNLGIAGSLSEKLKVGDLVWVRSSYAQNADRCEFKSFTFKDHSSIDCMTVNTRVTTLAEKKTLSSFADIIDRELWAIASAAHLFKIEMHALKLISDDLSSTDICQLVKDEAPALSKKLFTEYTQFKKSRASVNSIELITEKSNRLEDYILSHPKLYFTTSQTRKLTTVLKGLSLKKVFTDDEIKKLINELVESESSDKTSKELSKLLLNHLSERLNPLNTKIKAMILNSVSPLTDAGAQVMFDQELENEFIQVNYQIKSTKDQKRLILALEQFNYQKIKDIFSGKLGDDV
jgi:hypothetical protein